MSRRISTAKNVLTTFSLISQIEPNDEITKDVCKKCANKIVEIHQFSLMYLESDRKLRSLNESDCERCEPLLDSEFESVDVLPHEVVAVKTEVIAESLDFEAEDDADSSLTNHNTESDERPITKSTSDDVGSEKKPKRLVSLWECFACHKTYKSVKTIRKHSKNCRRTEFHSKLANGSYHKNVNNEFVCDLCNLSFKTRNAVYSHIQKHLGQKFLCNICGKCLSDRNNLTKHHKTVHLKEKNYQCPTCEKRYDSSYRLRIHQNSHQNIRQFPCPLCPLKFLTSSALSRHKQTVHKQGKLHECNVCFRKFNVAYNMRAHMVTHTGVRPHNCQYCKADFQRKHKLVTHLKEVHNMM